MSVKLCTNNFYLNMTKMLPSSSSHLAVKGWSSSNLQISRSSAENPSYVMSESRQVINISLKEQKRKVSPKFLNFQRRTTSNQNTTKQKWELTSNKRLYHNRVCAINECVMMRLLCNQQDMLRISPEYAKLQIKIEQDAITRQIQFWVESDSLPPVVVCVVASFPVPSRSTRVIVQRPVSQTLAAQRCYPSWIMSIPGIIQNQLSSPSKFENLSWVTAITLNICRT